MPVTPCTENEFARLHIHYTVGSYGHELLFHFQAATPAEAVATVTPILNKMKVFMSTADQFDGATFSYPNSNVSFPIAFTPIAGTGTTTPVAGDPEAFYWTWLGRDTGNHRTRWTLFTTSNAVTPPPSNRAAVGDAAAIQDVYDELVLAASTGVAGIKITTCAGGEPIISPYVNSGFNAYWRDKQRPSV